MYQNIILTSVPKFQYIVYNTGKSLLSPLRKLLQKCILKLHLNMDLKIKGHSRERCVCCFSVEEKYGSSSVADLVQQLESTWEWPLWFHLPYFFFFFPLLLSHLLLFFTVYSSFLNLWCSLNYLTVLIILLEHFSHWSTWILSVTTNKYVFSTNTPSWLNNMRSHRIWEWSNWDLGIIKESKKK